MGKVKVFRFRYNEFEESVGYSGGNLDVILKPRQEVFV